MTSQASASVCEIAQVTDSEVQRLLGDLRLDAMAATLPAVVRQDLRRAIAAIEELHQRILNARAIVARYS